MLTCAKDSLDADVLPVGTGAALLQISYTARSNVNKPRLRSAFQRWSWPRHLALVCQRLPMPWHLVLVHVPRSREHRAEPGHLLAPDLDYRV